MIIKRKAEKTSRSFKVSEIIRKAVGKVLVKNEMPLETPFKFPISVVQVEMNSDLKIAYVYVITHEELNEHEIILRLNFSATLIKSGTLAIDPSSFIISTITPAGFNPANLGRSMAASV